MAAKAKRKTAAKREQGLFVRDREKLLLCGSARVTAAFTALTPEERRAHGIVEVLSGTGEGFNVQHGGQLGDVDPAATAHTTIVFESAGASQRFFAAEGGHPDRGGRYVDTDTGKVYWDDLASSF